LKESPRHYKKGKGTATGGTEAPKREGKLDTKGGEEDRSGWGGNRGRKANAEKIGKEVSLQRWGAIVMPEKNMKGHISPFYIWRGKGEENR